MPLPNYKINNTTSAINGTDTSGAFDENKKPKISFFDRFYHLLRNTQEYHPLLCKDPVVRDHERRQRRRDIRTQLGKSRSGVQWGPTHSYDSEDDNMDVVAEVGGNHSSGRDDVGGRKLFCGDGGTSSTTQTCSTKGMSSQGYKPSSSKLAPSAPSTGVPQKQSSTPPPTTDAANSNNIGNHTFTQTTPIERQEGQTDDFSVSILPAASCGGTLDRLWNRASEFAKEYIVSPQTVGSHCHCHPCGNVGEDYISVHTVSTAHRQKNVGGNAKRGGNNKKQGTNNQSSHPVDVLRSVDINIENISLDDSSLTSTWIGKDFAKIEQHIKTKAQAVTPSKRSINTAMKENQNPGKNNEGTPTTANSTIYQSPPPPPPPSTKAPDRRPFSKHKSSQSSRRNISTRSLRHTKSTQSSSSQQQQQQQQQHTTPKTTDAHKQNIKYPQQSTVSAVSKLPFDSISFSLSQAVSLEKSISELTMRSCYTEALAIHQQQHHYPSSDHRRMAYYAVGREGGSRRKNGNGPGGNRRCYFSGNMIHSGRPFYAGSVQEGLRTLVVFCLPRTLHIPQRCQLDALLSSVPKEHRIVSSPDDSAVNGTNTLASNSIAHGGGRGGANSTYAKSCNTVVESRNGNRDDDNRVAEEIDKLLEKGILKAEQVLDILPHPGIGNGVDLLAQMESLYPDQYATLPPQVQLIKCWRLYFKFCFFSGLPIADGEMYYKVTDRVMDRLRSRSQAKMLSSSGGGGDDLGGVEEIILCHEIMEAVNGEQSAQILRLPNKKTFRYLQKQYEQQCTKLGGKVFDRTSWEMVMPEV